MNKQQLVEKLSEKTGETKRTTAEFVDAFMATVTEELSEGGKVQLIGFGTFETRERAARVGRNPKNPDEKVDIPARVVPVFKAGKALKEKVK